MFSSPDEVLEQILRSRGLTSKTAVENFLNPDYERDLHDPYLLPDMEKAVRRIVRAVKSGERIVVYGDYDIDGLCASSILYKVLGQLTFTDVFIPDRFVEGYGLQAAALRRIKQSGAQLVITVDCGSNSIKEIESAQKSGLDVIVTDHHELGDALPPAVAVVNPKRADSKYPFSDLSGTGVAFKLVQALIEAGVGPGNGQEKWLLDLAAFGTVCDVVSLTGENRSIVHYGLKVMSKTRVLGLKKLMQSTGIDKNNVNATTLGYIFGPRLNAAGRLEHAKHALRLLISDDESEAEAAAWKLESFNEERRLQQRQIELAAQELAPRRSNDPVLVLSHPEWSHGIVGIVAARLLEQFEKPVILLQELGETAKGSMRSFGDFHAKAALDATREFLITGGGHAAAAGLTLKTKDIDGFRRVVNDYYQSLDLNSQSEHLRPEPEVTIRDLAVLNLDLIKHLDRLQPFGHGNPQPLFRLENVTVTAARRVGSDQEHLKLGVKDQGDRAMDAIAFRYHKTAMTPATGQLVTLTGHLEANEFRGKVTPQLLVKRIEPA